MRIARLVIRLIRSAGAGGDLFRFPLVASSKPYACRGYLLRAHCFNPGILYLVAQEKIALPGLCPRLLPRLVCA